MVIYHSVYISNNNDISISSFTNDSDAIQFSKNQFEDNDINNPEGEYDFELADGTYCYYWNGESEGDHIFVIGGDLDKKEI